MKSLFLTKLFARQTAPSFKGQGGLSIKGEAGLSLMEVMVVVFTMSLISLAVTNSALVSFRANYFVRLKSAADTLALSKMEFYAAQDPHSLDASDNGTETGVSSPISSLNNVSFSRTTAITVNPDESRTVTVSVATEDPDRPSPRVTTTVTSTYSLWAYGS